MGTENATPLSAAPNTNWVNATFLMLDLEVVNFFGVRKAVNLAKPGTRAVNVLFAARGKFPASRGVRILAHPEKDGGDEVNR
jgi:hypothetical protein